MFKNDIVFEVEVLLIFSTCNSQEEKHALSASLNRNSLLEVQVISIWGK